MRVILYEQEGATRVHIDATITGKDDLQVAGHDIGEAPKRWWDHDDFEYIVTIRKTDKDRLLRALIEDLASGDEASIHENNKDRLLLDLIQEKFGDDPLAVSRFRDFVREKNIPHEWFSWP